MMAKRTALVTPSYDKDFDRCRLMCETMDRHVSGFEAHYLLVSHRDVALFKQLETSHRTVIDERELLPKWLWTMPDPLTMGRRQVWLSPFMKPLYGWHIQQMRRLAIASLIDVDGFFAVDSDVVFVREFSADQLWHGDDMRLYRLEGALQPPPTPEHQIWSDNAAKMLHIHTHGYHDYITTCVTWRRDMMLDMLHYLEEKNGTSWIKLFGRARDFSECITYGQYVDELHHGKRHYHADWSLCHIYWDGPVPDQKALDAFMSEMRADQVAVGLQSFINIDIGTVRRIAGL
ncbi:DUF6492 family protein [Brucellaceae bacterium C25G]